MAHKLLSGSQTKRFMNCPGSVNLTKDMPKRPSSVYAMEGTAAHHLLEVCGLGGYQAPTAYKGKIILVCPDCGNSRFRLFNDPANPVCEQEDCKSILYLRAFEVNEDMMDAVQVALDFVTKVLEDYALEDDYKVLVNWEKDVPMLWLHPDMGGTADIVIAVSSGDLHVMDYKHGRGVAVEVDSNHQLKHYASGVLWELDRAYDPENRTGIDWKIERVHHTIIQPRKPHSDGRVRTWVCEANQLRAWAYGELGPAGKEATESKNPRFAAGDWCKWCDAAASCKTLASQAAVSMFQNLDDPEVVEYAGEFDEEELVFIDQPGLQPVSPGSLKIEQVLTLYKRRAEIEDWFKSAEELIRQKLQAGEDVPGLKLVRKTKRATWDRSENDVLLTLKKKARGKRINQANYATKTTKLKSVTALRKVFGAELIDSMRYVPDTKETEITSIDDPRVRVDVGMFDDLGEEDA